MKKITCITFLLFISVAAAQNCNIGNEDPTGFNAANVVLTHNFLMGTKYTLSNAGTLQSINLIGKTNNGQVKMAVYSDNNGAPGNLLATTVANNIQLGINSYAVTPVHLVAGNYWVMAIYATSNNDVTYIKYGAIPGYYFYTSFNQNLPVDGAGFQNQGGMDYTYFLEITCDELHTVQVAPDAIRCYPNPVTDFVNLEIKEELVGSELTVYDALERAVWHRTLTDKVCSLDVSPLAKGVFFLKAGNNHAVKLIKQ